VNARKNGIGTTPGCDRARAPVDRIAAGSVATARTRERRHRLRTGAGALLLLLLAPGPVPVRASGEDAGAEARFRNAGTAYEAGRYEEAAAIYEELLAEGVDDARVHYNLGNARFKEGKIGPAILEYERAIERNPADQDARENLAYANLLTVDKVGPAEETFPERVLAAVESRLSAEGAAALFVALVVLASALALPLWFSRKPTLRRFLGGAVAGAASLAAASLLVAVALSVRMGGGDHAVVMAATADGRSAPSSEGTVLFTVHEGLKVEIRSVREGWLQIALPNGLVGWIESSQAAKI
jgi:hypothetical protein